MGRSSEASEEPSLSKVPHPSASRTKRLVVVAVSAIVVVGLALGLGLGLGLRHHHSQPALTSSNNSATSLQATPQTNFVLSGLQGQPAQDRVFFFSVDHAVGAPDGVQKPMLAVNGMSPGPTIEVNQNDRIIVHVTNHLENATSIHWHGLYQNGTNFYDGTSAITECGIPPGQTLTYNFTLGEFSGTTWWHAPYWHMLRRFHSVHGCSELVDSYLSPSGIDGTPGDEPVPDSGLLNGLGQWGQGGGYFDFTLNPNTTYRLRLINTGSFASIRFSIDNHPLTIIEADGTLVEPYTVSGVTLAVAQRYSVLIRTNQTQADGIFWMRTEIQTDMFTYDQPGQNTDIRGIIRYSNAPNPSAMPTAQDDPGPGVKNITDMDTARLIPAVQDVPLNRTRAYTVNVALENTSSGDFRAFFNGTSWEPLTGTSTLLSVRNAPTTFAPEGSSLNGDQFIITEDSIQTVDLIINNLDDGDHPFHLHGHKPYIMGTAPGRYVGQALNTKNPLRRDTMVIPAYNWMVLRFVTDNPGVWAFHCHIAWHMEAGLLMQINSLPSVAATLPFPQDILSQCGVPS
ncbi:multicopper oxidase family protein [Abortiporus biennis]